MAKLYGCRVCLIEMESIALANGGTVLFCAACDTMGDEATWPAAPATGRLAWPANP